MFILQIGFKNIKQHLPDITKCRARICYISKRSKPTHGAEIKEKQFVSQATINHSYLTYWQTVTLHFFFLTPSDALIIPWQLFKNLHFSPLRTAKRDLDTLR